MELGPETDDRAAQAREESNAIVVLASGNLGLVYFADSAERATLEALQAAYPGLLAALREHEGVGFLMIRSQTAGPVILGARGTNYLQDGWVEGEDPLAGFGPHAAGHLRRTDSFPDAPDILVNSFYDPETNEVAAFEEQIGSHGGLGGWQTEPFLLYPAEWQVPEEKIVGAEALHRVLKGWLDGLASRQAVDPAQAGREAG